MKKCPFCAEQIQDDAIKCRFCGEFLDKSVKPKTKWYFTTPVVVIALLCLGPLALPIVWINPHYNIITKFVVTILIILLTVFLGYLTTYIYARLIGSMSELGL